MTRDVESEMEVTSLLQKTEWEVVHVNSWEEVEASLKSNVVSLLLLDLDALPVTNRTIRDLKKEFPEIPILAISHQNFHPELKESLSTCVKACLSKPVDPDELQFWLRNLHEGQERSRCPPFSAGM